MTTIKKRADSFKIDYQKLTDFEALSLAIQCQRNEILQNGLVVSSDYSYPSALEKIAMNSGNA